MIVVSDTTPLISLLKIEHLNLLSQYFKEVLISPQIFKELTSNPGFANEAKIITNCPFIEVRKVKDFSCVDVLHKTSGLDLGESEAIALSRELNADLLLMDEKRGRTVAKQFSIKVMGTIGLLIASYEDGTLNSDEIKRCITVFQHSGRHIGKEYMTRLLNMLEKK